MGWRRYPEYISVAERREKAQKKARDLKKKGKSVNPVIITGRTIATTFWGKAWCKHLESYSDFENRLPRGRSYVRSGAVVDLTISQGEVKALVQGSKLYTVTIEIVSCTRKHWQRLVSECSGKIDSLIELLQGKFSKSVMEIITHKEKGLFPELYEIKFDCSCPDYAVMCKHVAAVLYGVGARLDERPEELFILRHVDHLELISSIDSSTLTKTKTDELQESDLSSLFNIEIEESPKTKKRAIKEDTTKKPKKKKQ